jgi:hypothetical protein
LGVSQAVAFGLIAMVALSTLASMALIYQKSQDVYDEALQSFHASQILSDETLIRIYNVSLTGVDLQVGIANNGSTNLYDYEHFSVIVDYAADLNGTATPSVQSYNFTSSSPSVYEWTSLTGILLPEELGEFEIVLPAPVFTGTIAFIVITTNYGPSAEWRGTP